MRGMSIGEGVLASEGMISPINPFVDPDGTLTSVSFRFLHALFVYIHELEMEVDKINQRLQTAGIP